MLRCFKSEEKDHMCNTFFSVAMKYSLDWHVQYLFFHFFQVPHFDGKVQYFLQMNFKCIAWKPATHIYAILSTVVTAAIASNIVSRISGADTKNLTS